MNWKAHFSIFIDSGLKYFEDAFAWFLRLGALDHSQQHSFWRYPTMASLVCFL